MDDMQLPEQKAPEIYNYKPGNAYDRDRGAQSLGYVDEADLTAIGGPSEVEKLDEMEIGFMKNNDQIIGWLENHTKTVDAVIMLTDRLKSLEERFSEHSSRIRALEARIGIEES
jgi:hypothetical protein